MCLCEDWGTINEKHNKDQKLLGADAQRDEKQRVISSFLKRKDGQRTHPGQYVKEVFFFPMP